MSTVKNKKLIIVGDSAFAEIAHEYFDADTDYEVVAFSVESSFIKGPTKRGLPIVSFETIEKKYSTEEHEIFVATVYTQLNRLRTRLSNEAKNKGFRLASYISPRAFVWRNVQMGEHCFIFEDNTVQPFVEIGNNVVLWSGNHIGHHSKVHDNCFISSHVCISGFCEIGRNSFIGVNATIANNVSIGEDNWIGLGASIVKNTSSNQLFKGKQAEVSTISALDYFKVS